MRKRYEITEDQLATILDACKPVNYMIIGGVEPRSPQQNANDAWQRLGAKLGFDYKTVRPTSEGNRFFTAEVKIALCTNSSCILKESCRRNPEDHNNIDGCQEWLSFHEYEDPNGIIVCDHYLEKTNPGGS